MLNTSHNRPIKIGILEASAQNTAILEYFFANSGKSQFKKTTIDYADAYIIDYDFPGAKENLEALLKKANKPVILISIAEVALPSTVWIAKPLTSVAMVDAGKKIKEILHENVVVPDLSIEVEETSQRVEPEEVKAEKNQEEAHKKENSKAELAVAGTNESEEFVFDTLSPPDNEVDLNEDISIKANDTQENDTDLKLENIDFEELSKKQPAPKETNSESLKVADMIEFDSLNSEENTSESSPLPKQMPLDTFENESESTEFPLELKTISNESESNKEVSTQANDGLVNNEAEISLDNATTKPEISTLGDFAILPTLIKVDENPTVKKAEETTTSTAKSIDQENIKNDTQEETLINENDLPDEEDMDALLETLISGGKKKKESENLIDGELVDGDSQLETSDNNNNSPLDAPAFELETIEKSDLIDDISLQDDASLPLIQDDATSVLVESYVFSGEELTEIDSDIADTIGEEIYITPIEPEEGTSAEKVAYNKKTAEEELQSLLDELKEEAESNGQNPSSLQASDSFSNNNSNSTAAESRWKLICGSNDDEIIDDEENEENTEAENENSDSDSFTLANHMLSSFLDVLEQSKYTNKVMRLKFKGHIIVVDHSENFIFCDNSIFSESYAQVCYDTINEADIKIHELDKSEIRLYNTKRIEEPRNFHSIEAFIWTTSLLTARGRLLKYTDMNKKVGLRYWPNLTRLEQFPHAMQIAAVFYKHPGSLTEVSEWLNIDQRYIFAFYNAALSLNLIELDSKKIYSSSSDLTKASNKNRGFFSRLLKRITS